MAPRNACAGPQIHSQTVTGGNDDGKLLCAASLACSFANRFVALLVSWHQHQDWVCSMPLMCNACWRQEHVQLWNNYKLELMGEGFGKLETKPILGLGVGLGESELLSAGRYVVRKQKSLP